MLGVVPVEDEQEVAAAGRDLDALGTHRTEAGHGGSADGRLAGHVVDAGAGGCEHEAAHAIVEAEQAADAPRHAGGPSAPARAHGEAALGGEPVVEGDGVGGLHCHQRLAGVPAAGWGRGDERGHQAIIQARACGLYRELSRTEVNVGCRASNVNAGGCQGCEVSGPRAELGRGRVDRDA
jgi:hypothetical protein